VKEPKIVASPGFTSSYMAFWKELFYQTVYQNGSSSTDKAVHGAKAQKTASLVKWRAVPNGALMST
jgi:hypothetical protein